FWLFLFAFGVKTLMIFFFCLVGIKPIFFKNKGIAAEAAPTVEVGLGFSGFR
ncbi:hypothetical protein ACVW0Y_000876, partial [Pseudomonas sp. TE3786]